MFPDPNNGAAFVPESETNLVGSEEQPGFLLVGLKMADKKLGMIGIERAIRLATAWAGGLHVLHGE